MPHFSDLLMENSQQRLVDLVVRRTQPGADKQAIDSEIWDLFGEQWTVMLTDLSGFSRRVAEFGIIHFVQVVIESERLFAPLLRAHGGFVLKREGDSLLVLFRNPRQALACARAMQAASRRYSLGKPEEDKVILGVGLSHGLILRLGATEVYGAAVNAASKLGEDTAGQYEILLTEEFREACGDPFPGQLRPLEFIPPGSRGAFRLVDAEEG